ncbi:MAG: radical SAM protein [Phycisphaerae bacterium]|nr:radical SAM protein [Phycisphaerae bacterium]
MRRIEEKLAAGQRLDLADGLALFACPDVHALGRLADTVRRRRHGVRTFYNINCHINYSNVCVLACGVCGFSRRAGEAGAYEMGVTEVAARAACAARAGADEVHITGGLHPDWPMERYEAMVRAVRRAAPTLHIKAFTAAEIAHMAARGGVTVEAVLRRLMAAGLDSLPGGGAEIFDPHVRAAMFPRKLDAAGWLAVHRQAHRLGLRSNATMLYGHAETQRHRVEHLLTLRALQDETGGFQAFVPLPFIPAATKRSEDGPPRSTGVPPVSRMGVSPMQPVPKEQTSTSQPNTNEASTPCAKHGRDARGTHGQDARATPRNGGGIDDLRTLAVARLMLDNFDHVKTFWIMHGLKLSQLALHFGADDVDGTVMRYAIVEPPDTAVSESHLRKLIEEAGLNPVKRDSFYQPRQGARHVCR